MAVFRIFGDEVLTKASYLDRLSTQRPRGGLEGAETIAVHPMRDVLARADDASAAPTATRFAPIGPGKPLTILIRHVYPGKHPEKPRFGGSAKPMVVVSGLKDYAAFAPSTRAVNFLMDRVEPRKPIKAPSTFESGTNVIAYSPAVLTDAFHYTVEIAFDRFDASLFELVAKGLSSAAGIPLLMPAQGYLLAAGSLVRTGAAWADALVDGRAAFSNTDTLEFNIPGAVPPSADFRLMADFDATGMTYDPVKGLMRGDQLYDGDEPYVVVSLDGAERKNLESFSPTLATSAVMKQFFAMRDGVEASVEAIMEGMKLVNDLKHREAAEDLAAQLAAAAEPDKAALKARLEAVKKNILNAALRPA